MKFKSRKDILFSIILLGLNAFLVGYTIFEIISGEMKKNEYWTLIPIVVIVGLLFWMYFGTNYELNQKEFIFRGGPFKGKIKIDRITEIVKGKTHWVGIKYATARKGLIVKFDKYNEIYISPKTDELFIEKIVELNSGIKITTG